MFFALLSGLLLGALAYALFISRFFGKVKKLYPEEHKAFAEVCRKYWDNEE